VETVNLLGGVEVNPPTNTIATNQILLIISIRRPDKVVI